MALVDLSALKDIYSESTCILIDTFISRIKSAADQAVYKKVFLDFYDVTGDDVLLASPDAIANYVEELRRRQTCAGQKYTTVLKYYKILNAFFTYCVGIKKENTLVPKKFENNLYNYKMYVKEDVFSASKLPSRSELDTLLGYLKANDQTVFIAVMLALRCYIKTGDMLTLRTGNVFYNSDDKCYIEIPGREDLVPVPNDVAGVLDTYFSENLVNGDYLLKGRGGSAITRAPLCARLRKACATCNIKGVTFNDLRNYAAVVSASNGASAETLNQRMGYKTTAHIKRLTSLMIPPTDTKDYVNIIFK